MALNVPVIDLFAGPGGLGEGFSAHRGEAEFDVVLSIEKDLAARETLKLRKFFRAFADDVVPDMYYDYISGRGPTRQDLYKTYQAEHDRAEEIAWFAELGRKRIKTVWEKIDNALNGAEHWVLLGGPPCQAYSIMGRARMKSMEGFANDKRHTLYREYLKTIARFQPTIFVMENVKGILSSKHKDQKIFQKILTDLRDPWAALSKSDRDRIPDHVSKRRYRIYSFVRDDVDLDEQLEPMDYLIESERYGIPQARHRVILFGIRDDYDVIPPALQEADRIVTVQSVIGSMPKLRSRISRGRDKDAVHWVATLRKGPQSKFLSEVTDREVRKHIREVRKELSDRLKYGGRYVASKAKPKALAGWLRDVRLKGVVQHETRSHMESDLQRYLFSACFAEVWARSPKLTEFPESLLPDHESAKVGEDGRVANFSDRFRVQLAYEPSTTITAHIRKDGHYFIHPDPRQCRSLTVREAARLQTFPDNYFFEGNRTEQFQQVGNAVPPYLAYQLADVVAEVLVHCMDLDIECSPMANVRYIAG